jgi:hypothetical protein
MIRVLVMYPNEPGKKFDMDYYLNKHITMVNDTIGDLGLVRGSRQGYWGYGRISISLCSDRLFVF